MGEVLGERQIPVDRILVGDVDSLPDSWGYERTVAMGGPMGVYEEAEYPGSSAKSERFARRSPRAFRFSVSVSARSCSRPPWARRYIVVPLRNSV